jgi:carbonic anhydrase/acetyltransferase-like protein (isoleucine patch superfamily)
MQLNTAIVPAANFTVPDNATTTINTHYNNLTIGKNAIVTVNGTIYGKIVVKEGALVTFTASVININNLNTENGKASPVKNTTMNFSGATVRVKDKVVIGDRNRVNGTNTTFYMGDLSPDAEKFTVNGNDTKVTANVYMPHGKLNVPGRAGLCIMTGKYIAEDIESDNTVTWNGYDCAVLPKGPGYTEEETGKTPVADVADAFKVNVYPNPFNPTTTIVYGLPVDANVSIEVYNVLGERVAQLVEGRVSAGYYTVPFDGSSLSSGMYMYRMTALGNNGEHFVKIGKMMLMK